MRLRLVSVLNVARLGLNDEAKLWISFNFFSKQKFFITHIIDLQGAPVISGILLTSRF